MRGLLGIVLLATLFASCLATCRPALEGRLDCYICEGLNSLELDLPAGTVRIEIRNSTIPRIPANALSNYADSLTELGIIDSGVEEIEADAFKALINLQNLRLHGNKIRRIQASWLRGLPQLRSLILYRNRILDIEPEVYDLLPELQILDVAYNELRDCPHIDEISKLKNLRKVLVAGNPWPLRCRAKMTKYLGINRILIVKDWGVSDLWIEECLAHEPGADLKDDILQKCVDRLSLENTSSGCSLMLTDLNEKLRGLSGRIEQLEIDLGQLKLARSSTNQRPSE